MSQLTCKNLSLGYEGNIIIKDLNFHINKGDYVCIVGSNGAGKSTLMKAILGLKKASSGEILLGDGLLRTEFGYLTQQSEVQKDFPASVIEIVRSGCQSRSVFRPFYTKEEKDLSNKALERMGILHLAKRHYSDLSGGQQQRVLLSRALCATKKIMFLDEPTTGLDQNVSQEFYSVIEELNKEDKITIVMISHDIEKSLEYATHILHIGEDIFFGTKEDYLKSKNISLFKEQSGGDK